MSLSDPSEDSEKLIEELRGLAIELHRRRYSHVTQWKPASGPRSLLSQIDNMTAGMAMRIEQLEAAVSWVRVRDATQRRPEGAEAEGWQPDR
jgi:hypothetical protein